MVVSNNNVWDTFIASLSAVGTAAALASTGVYLHQQKFVPTPQSKQMLSRYSQHIGLPCLFFTKMLTKKDAINNEAAFPGMENSAPATANQTLLLLLWPVYVVSCGLLVGYALARVAGLPTPQRTALMVATAFANSTGLPTTLLSMLTINVMGGGGGSDVVVDPTIYLSVYLVLYPVLQWSIGGTLLGLGDDDATADNENKNVNDDNNRILLRKSSSIGSLKCHDDDDEVTSDDEQMIFLTSNDHINANSHDHDLAAVDKEAQVANGKTLSSSHCQMLSHKGWNQLHAFVSTAMRGIRQPPVVGALSGWLMASIPPLKVMWTQGSLKWMGQAVATVGQSAIPINMAVLGVNLSMTFGEKPTSTHNDKTHPGKETNRNLLLSVVAGKLIIMPVIGLTTVRSILFFSEGLDASIALVMVLVFCTPTANNVMVMTDLSHSLDAGIKQGMARMLASQYVVAPVLLSLWVMLALRISHQSADEMAITPR